MKNKILIVLLVIIIFSALSFLFFLKEEGGRPAERRLPQKMVLTEKSGGWAYYELDQEEGIYEQFEKIDDHSHSQVVGIDERRFFWESDGILGHSFDSGVIGSENESLFEGEIKAVATYKDNVYVCAEGSLIVLNKDLKEIGRTSLDIGRQEWEKNAHDIFVDDDVAYLLDNLVNPVYVLRINVEEPADPEIIEKIEIKGIYQHLSHQWLDADNEQWVIVQDESSMAGWSSKVLFFDVSDKEEGAEIGSQLIYEADRAEEGGDGFEIISVTEKSPVWAITSKDDQEGYFLVQIRHKKGEISLEKEIHLIEGSFEQGVPDPVIKFHEGYIFVVYKNNLMVIDTEKEDEIIMEQSFPGLSKINDLVIY